MLITTGSGNDIIHGGGGADIINAGAGNDAVDYWGTEVSIDGGGRHQYPGRAGVGDARPCPRPISRPATSRPSPISRTSMHPA